MIINHNMGAMNANRQMGINAANANKSMEKLSSGLRINKAGDDAAGLAISEKMRGQIRGLDQASANAQDGISMIQTAEGALSETTSIIQRMRELSVQASSDTNTADDRVAVQKEVEQLKSEIDRIGNTTEFNTTKLIDGSIGAMKVPGTDNAAVISSAVGTQTAGSVTTVATTKAGINDYAGESATFKIDGADIKITHTANEIKAFASGSDADSKGLAEKLQADINKSIDAYNTANGKEIKHITVTSSADKNGTLTFKSGSTGGASTVSIASGATGNTNFAEKVLGQTAATVTSGTGKEGVYSAGGAGAIAGLKTLAGNAGAAEMTFTVDGTDIKIDLNASETNKFKDATGAALNGDMTVQATALESDFNKAIDAYNATVPTDKAVSHISVSVKEGSFVFESGSTESTSSVKFDNSQAAQLLGVANQSSATQGGGVEFQIGANSGQTMKITVGDMRTAAIGLDSVDMSSKEGAKAATELLDTALKTVSGQRADLGAFSNRLEHTINNLGTSSENLTSAESRIRDVDMAKEMSTFSKNNILSQAAQAMLAQANQQPQQVLSLLR